MTVYLRDVPKIHLDALYIAGNQDFPANSGGIDSVTFNDALDIVAKHIQEGVARYTVEGIKACQKAGRSIGRTWQGGRQNWETSRVESLLVASLCVTFIVTKMSLVML